ncbi:type IV pilus biogenesis/stability protein PilW [Kingella negevensis]|uniref:type IV pilus biogenesis/stability protein PilW n=2 Tax=Kingella negevensis TaxID=1522312 RepID=UPI0025431963|nr:type IV pilus biogenesis/stability protein PilW [Kingella negevensis]MDK4680691.1 type IV pilus biogenesis/stability protein PilW [Kingella negevensis]MDK4681585.1 type IV pilus biogenesis/stability protein PilW [Kingella negevensis]WII92907.1 type IV pilus biogenesis/stability protein PilW [Kingella negevensis]
MATDLRGDEIMMKTSWLAKIAIAIGLGTMLSGCVTEGNSIAKLKKRSRSEIAKESSQIRTQLAIEYTRAGDYRSATKTIEEVLKEFPNYDFAWLVRAQIYQHLKVTDKAEESFRRALSISPNSAEINNNYGWFLCSAKNMPTQSIAYFDKALQDPTYPSPEVSYLNKGICTAKSGQANMADAYFERALQNNPDFVPVHKERARAYLGNEKLAEADRSFRKYQSLVAALNADDLLLGYHIAKANGEDQNASEYQAQLKANYPYSDELKSITSGNTQ